jgi:hypothetical protein
MLHVCSTTKDFRNGTNRLKTDGLGLHLLLKIEKSRSRG